jgi:hypothetical protein
MGGGLSPSPHRLAPSLAAGRRCPRGALPAGRSGVGRVVKLFVSEP